MALQPGAVTPYSETPLFLDYIYILAENANFVNHIFAQILLQMQHIFSAPYTKRANSPETGAKPTFNQVAVA